MSSWDRSNCYLFWYWIRQSNDQPTYFSVLSLPADLPCPHLLELSYKPRSPQPPLPVSLCCLLLLDAVWQPHPHTIRCLGDMLYVAYSTGRSYFFRPKQSEILMQLFSAPLDGEITDVPTQLSCPHTHEVPPNFCGTRNTQLLPSF